jgi:pyruvate/2-oxoglutarate dehydrogenase complex dihydrolipoamide acyltransferase (E2) component
MVGQRHEVVLPDHGLGTLPLRAGAWFVGIGSNLIEGDRLLEVYSKELVVEISAPTTGKLVEKKVKEDEPVHVGQLLCVLVSED